MPRFIGRNDRQCVVTEAGSLKYRPQWAQGLVPILSRSSQVHTGRGALRNKLWNTMWWMEVFTQLASNIKGFVCKFACKWVCERALNRLGLSLRHIESEKSQGSMQNFWFQSLGPPVAEVLSQFIPVLKCVPFNNVPKMGALWMGYLLHLEP